MKTVRVAIALMIAIGAGGCAYVSPFPIGELPDRSEAVAVRRMNGEAVHGTLGKPRIESRRWGVEVYRDDASQVEVPIALVIPFARIRDDIYRYTLVAYGKDGFAESAATGLYRRPAEWRIASPVQYNHLDLRLETGDFAFTVEWQDRRETLLAAPAWRDAYLERARRSPECTVVVGCGERECSDSLRVDGGPELPLPCRLKGYRTVAAIGLPPGSHSLTATGGRMEQLGLLRGERSIEFSCRRGEIVYLVVDVTAKEYGKWWGATGIEWKLDLREEMPEFFTGRHLVLYRDGRWIADPGPAD